MDSRLDRARGCLLGQLIGDSLGSLVEFQRPEQIRQRYPDGVRELESGGTWNTIAGQPTDDSEMALALARSLQAQGAYDQNEVRNAYIDWLDSRPFDVGNTVAAGLRGTPNFESQANGALMRISPLGIFAVGKDPDLVARWAREDAWITHPHEVTQDANVLFVLTISSAIELDGSAERVAEAAREICVQHGLVEPVRQALENGIGQPPDSYLDHRGWMLIALQNAYYQLVNAPSLEEALIDTVGRGGDTDTNAAICGALLGSVHWLTRIPARWSETVIGCRPEEGTAGVHNPRPEVYWPVDALDLAESLLQI